MCKKNLHVLLRKTTLSAEASLDQPEGPGDVTVVESLNELMP